MEVILISKRRSGARVHLGLWGVAFLGVVATGVGGAALYGAYRLGAESIPPAPAVSAMRVEAALAAQQGEVRDAIENAERNLDAIALRLGEMRSQVMRLDALGERLVDMAELDPDEFDFRTPPGRGGPELSAATVASSLPDFLSELRALETRLDDRGPKLGALESVLMNARLRRQVHPEGRPVLKGWISSFFGYRSDPFTGRRVHHEGVDFSGKPASPVVAVAAGVVVFSGWRPGYGNVIDINHGSGYTTRYAHNRKNLVQAGETVRKGQRLALMGATGRVTGHHVHFEVLQDGKPVDPLAFVRGER